MHTRTSLLANWLTHFEYKSGEKRGVHALAFEPTMQPLCGAEWLWLHRHDNADFEPTMTVSYGGHPVLHVNGNYKPGMVKDAIERFTVKSGRHHYDYLPDSATFRQYHLSLVNA